ncbi:hypothetical protein BKCO1_34000101 [Neofusicoccum parvum]|uniref:Uncharacterized protein n=2 Tax=Neofusicoccum parvum TaxID=310453 RepID=R1GS40_BOTPV|nr:hypothetical protein UCRNP2_2171 [Neofusicoccum parvum UCRNP2]GME41950.1 hypothetical protein BKCO1_34000101 [Neofusicoccum parvum]GME60530.1 hypothetical protein BKCO1_34000101 [Neofusicoccum parvum]
MADPASPPDAVAGDARTQSQRTMEHLEWLGGHLHPLEQSILLNNLEKFMKDSDNMSAKRIGLRFIGIVRDGTARLAEP